MAEGHTYGTIGRLIAAIQAGIAGIILTLPHRLFYGANYALAGYLGGREACRCGSEGTILIPSSSGRLLADTMSG